MARKMALTGTLLKWGNSYGIRVSKADVERLQLSERQQIEIGSIRPLKNPLRELWDADLDVHISREELKEFRDEFWESRRFE